MNECVYIVCNKNNEVAAVFSDEDMAIEFMKRHDSLTSVDVFSLLNPGDDISAWDEFYDEEDIKNGEKS